MATKADETATRGLAYCIFRDIRFFAEGVSDEILSETCCRREADYYRRRIEVLSRQTEFILRSFQLWHERDETFAAYATSGNQMLKLLRGAMESLEGVGLNSAREEARSAFKQCSRHMTSLAAEISQLLLAEGGAELAVSRESQRAAVTDTAPVPPSPPLERIPGVFLPDETTTAPLDLDRLGTEALVVVDTSSLRLPDRFPGE